MTHVVVLGGTGHISGPGWVPINPAGNLDVDVYRRLAEGEEVTLPNLGMETLHHVHADDVAQSFTAAMAHRSVAVGKSFHVVSPAALTLRGYAESVAGWYGRAADLAFLPWERWRETVSPESGGPDLGPHRAQPQQQHREGGAAARLPAQVQLARGGPGGTRVAGGPRTGACDRRHRMSCRVATRRPRRPGRQHTLRMGAQP